jgi:tetratricopeptide (TPR) repeat protein
MTKIVAILFIIPIIGFSQTKYDRHDELISKASKLQDEANYKKALIAYEDALDILIPNSGTCYFKAAECALKLEDTKIADKWIRKGIAQGGAQMDYLRKYRGFSEIQEADFYKKIISDYNSLRLQYFSTKENIDIYLEIEEMVIKDQYARQVDRYLNGVSPEQMNRAADSLLKARIRNDTVAINKYMKIVFPKRSDLKEKLMRKTDSINILRLMEITEEYGWQQNAWIILWHQRGNHDEDNWVWNYFRPIINKEIEKGKISRSFWDPFNQEREMTESFLSGFIPNISIKKANIKN